MYDTYLYIQWLWTMQKEITQLKYKHQKSYLSKIKNMVLITLVNVIVTHANITWVKFLK